MALFCWKVAMRAELIAAPAALGLALVLGFALSVPAAAQTAPQSGMPQSAAPQSPVPQSGTPQRIIATGCPYAGVTANCLMIKSSDGKVYNITSITPRPRQMNRMIRLRGTVSDKASACNEGVVLDRVRWTRIRQQCAN
jgi:hypothetical protein